MARTAVDLVHVMDCDCHGEELSALGKWCEDHDHPYLDPECERLRGRVKPKAQGSR